MSTCWYMWEDTGKTNMDVWWTGVWVYWRFKFVLRGQAAAGAGEACMCWMVRDKVTNLHLNATQSFGLYLNLNCSSFFTPLWCIGIVGESPCAAHPIESKFYVGCTKLGYRLQTSMPSSLRGTLLLTDPLSGWCTEIFRCSMVITSLTSFPEWKNSCLPLLPLANLNRPGTSSPLCFDPLTLPVPPVQVPQAESVKPSESKSSWEKDGIADWRTGCGRADSDWKGSPQARIAKNHLAVCWHLWWVLANNGTSTVSISIRSREWNWEICDVWYLHLTVRCPSVSYVVFHRTLSTSHKASPEISKHSVTIMRHRWWHEREERHESQQALILHSCLES